MSLGLIKPGASVVLRHPKTGAVIEPLYVRKNGSVVWPVLGAGPDDPDDPKYSDDDPEDDSDDDDDDEDEEEEKPRRKKKSSRKPEDDTDEDDEDDDKPTRPERQAARYRTRLRESERKNQELADRLKALEDQSRPTDEVMERDLNEAKQRVTTLSEVNQVLTAQLAFFKSNTVSWVDPNDAFALAEREGLFDDVVDEDGNVDERELRRGLKDLAKRKPHLVKKDDEPKARGRKITSDDTDEDEDDEQSSRSGSTMNGSRRGKRQAGPSRTDLAKKYPVLNRV